MSNKTCFLICPIGEENSETRKHSDTVFEHILKPVMIEKEYELVRADRIIQADTITDSIIKCIETSDLVIADITESNPNVYYELGYRTALKKPIIQIAANGTRIPFDISLKRTFFFDKNNLQNVDNFKTLLLTLIDNIESNQKESINNSPIVTQGSNVFGDAFTESIATKLFDKIFFDSAVKSEEVFKNLRRLKELGDQYAQSDKQ